MAEGFQIDLPCCNKPNCEIHTDDPLPLPQEIFTVLGSRLKEMVLYISRCSRSVPDYPTFDNLTTANKVVNICTVWTPPVTMDISTHYLYHWGVSSSANDLEDLVKKTISGGKVNIEIIGDSTLRDIPNIFEILGNRVQKYRLKTDFKIKSLGNSLNPLNSCRELYYRIPDTDQASMEAEEIDAMNRLLAHVAVDPRPMGPELIRLSKVYTPSCQILTCIVIWNIICPHRCKKTNVWHLFLPFSWLRYHYQYSSYWIAQCT